MHPIDEIMEERCPNLMRNKILWSFIKPSIFKIFKYYDAKRICLLYTSPSPRD